PGEALWLEQIRPPAGGVNPILDRRDRRPIELGPSWAYIDQAGCGILPRNRSLEQGLMIRLSKSADYGLMAMRHLALLPQGCCCSARELAQGHGIPPALLAKLLQRLARKGLIAATHGIKGGYRI